MSPLAGAPLVARVRKLLLADNPLGDAAALPTISIVEKFEEEFVAHLNGEPCPDEKSSRLVAA